MFVGVLPDLGWLFPSKQWLKDIDGKGKARLREIMGVGGGERLACYLDIGNCL